MREIKLRFWHKEKKQMIEGLLEFWIKIAVETGIMPDYKNLGVWMQYTGLKDKNGIKIYEGDIVKMVVSKFMPDEDGLDHEEIIVKIYFSNGSFWFVGGGRRDCNWHFYNASEREVIGNIYENNELLPKGE